MDESLFRRFLEVVDERRLYSSAANLRFYGDRLFGPADLSGRTVLDVGGGTGIYSFYALGRGARRVVCLEPEASGATSGVGRIFEEIHRALGRPPGIVHDPRPLLERDPGEERFDVLLLNNSINHLDEEACIALERDPEAARRFHRIFRRLHELGADGARLIVTDCSRRNLFPDLRLPHPLLPQIEWEKHQPPGVWAAHLAQGGFADPRVSWSSFNRLRQPGRWLLGNAMAAYFLTSHFRLEMRRDRAPRTNPV